MARTPKEPPGSKARADERVSNALRDAFGAVVASEGRSARAIQWGRILRALYGVAQKGESLDAWDRLALAHRDYGAPLRANDRKGLHEALYPWAEAVADAVRKGRWSSGTFGPNGANGVADLVPGLVSLAGLATPHLADWPNPPTSNRAFADALIKTMRSDVKRFSDATAVIREVLRAGGMSRKEANEVGAHLDDRDRASD